MNIWDEYRSAAMVTAVFPPERSVDYTALGLVSEIAELIQVKQDHSITNWMVREANYKKEAGDAFWYVAAMCDALETPMSAIKPRHSLDMYRDNSHWTDLDELFDSLVVSSGFLAGLTKKAIRDDKGTITEGRKNLMLATLTNILTDLVRVSYALSSTPQKIMGANIAKLADRKERGVLQGAGDNR